MKSSDLRQSFLSFFEKQGHKVVASSSLVPGGDGTLLFANAGMNQFKDLFTGQATRNYTRATSSQKCVRAGGKHNDLENVGYTARHHTFFEMLGNFSFGDYFKAEAMQFAWRYVTGELGLDGKRLWITVHESDDEAEKLWLKISGLPRERIVRLGDKDNFWAMGDTGPCGPCSEIHIDMGPKVGHGRPDSSLANDSERFLEFWNLVFMQYEQKADGRRVPLPNPCVDTGMGLERLSTILNGVYTNYDTDLFVPLIKGVTQFSGRDYRAGEEGVSHRVIADHTKAAAFLIADGVLPSNEGRGYVLRRIMRRAIRHAWLLGVQEPMLVKLLPVVEGIYGDAYPELLSGRDRIAGTVRDEEERFLKTIDKGLHLFGRSLPRWKSAGKVSGADAFMLYDTYGFPLDLTQVMAGAEGVGVDESGFDTCMQEQREKARQASMFETSRLEGLSWTVRHDAAQQFVGYEKTVQQSRVLRTARVAEGGPWLIVPETCSFYAESGGQVGDTGTIEVGALTLEVSDTQLVEGRRVLVLSAEVKGLPDLAAGIVQRVDVSRRQRIAAHHTCTHLLHKALKEVLGERAEQRGSWVGPTHLRFDFPHGSAVGKDKLQLIEEKVNADIQHDLRVETQLTSFDKAVAKGVTALFGEKYGDEVRVVDVAGRSQELCGGTHLGHTGQAMAFVIRSEGAVASGIRRIEALAGPAALLEMQAARSTLQQLSSAVQARPEELQDRFAALREENVRLAKEIESLRVEQALADLAPRVDSAISLGEYRLLAHFQSGLDAKTLRVVAERLRTQYEDLILLLAGSQEDKVSLVLSLPRASVKTKGWHAGKAIKSVAAPLQGGGGGQAEFAQAGGKSAEGFPQAVQALKAYLDSAAGT